MTLNEIIYRIKEYYKLNSDDLSFDYPDELIANLVNTKRAWLIRQRFKDERKRIPKDMYQKLCIDLSLYDLNPDVCIGEIVRSDQTLPNLLETGSGYKLSIIKQGNDFPLNLNYVSIERLPYTGFNSLIKNQMYVAVDYENYLFLKGDNEFHQLIDEIVIFAVLEDPFEAENYTCTGDTTPCDLFTDPYPLSDDLIEEVIGLVQADLAAKQNIPEDQINNADETNR